MASLSDLLEERGVLLADGATGSNLFEMGLQSGESPELWNDLHPDRIAANYRSFIDAGSDIILTNTFGGNRFRLGLHDASDRVGELNAKAARIAREQVDRTRRPVIVGGSMGPTGEILEPLGSLSIERAAEVFAEQALALEAGGADVIWIETISSLEEAQAALAGAAETDLPAVLTFSVDTNGRTMMGLTPSEIVKFTAGTGHRPFAVGANCGVGAADLIASVINMQHEVRNLSLSTIVIAKANCGVPEYVDGKIVYSGTEAIMSEYARIAMDSGARIIGGCCGTTPNHVRAMRDAIDGHRRGDFPDVEKIESKLGPVSTGARSQMLGDLSIAGGARRPPRERKTRRGRRR
ncbi:MAG: betaine--homocysteine S-methyltransferase [Gammaproteobacteria bacterium]|nr:betaine--homocysteine S-methyltransferase [Gammaproteobacteria bacterium]MYD77092.1 betaine--homocysteine S-methyltransferase [Gammaproteobacteria bacterium]MYJ51476.1 betaine--homocysteine S-methyltransferase [Gammaproteobacteria bacterium]